MTGETTYDPEYADHHQDVWTCEDCGAENSDMDHECQFCDAGQDEDACEECGGDGTVIYDRMGEGPIPCKKCNGRGF
jgi:DnaJ-class molecular chaperone